MNILSIIPARGGSKGIPLKNIVKINGKPLLYYTIQASLQTLLVTRTVVSTDNEKIAKIAKKMNVEVIKRPKKIATDTASTESVIRHCLKYLKQHENYSPDIIVLLQNTSPLRTKKHIGGAIKKFLKYNFDSLLSGFSSHYFLWNKTNNTVSPVSYNPKKRPIRQKFNNQFIENGAIYITTYSAFQKSNCRISGKIGLYEMTEKCSADIDTKEDLERIRKLIKK